MALRIIATGGTFDKRYDPITGTLGFDDTILGRLVAEARLQPAPAIEVAMLVDSLDMTEAQRADVVARCAAAPEDRIVVVHGTDTMVETARALADAQLGRTIVLAGAMVPARIEHSDAPFNLGFAAGAAAALPPGVWVAMNGVIRSWDAVRKNRAAGVFESSVTQRAAD